MRAVPCAFVFFLAGASARAQDAAYRHRLLGVYDSQTAEPIEGAEVSDALNKNSALTTKTGTVSLVFLPEGGTLIRVRKLGYKPATLMVAISPADTVPLTVLLEVAPQELPAVVTKADSSRYRSTRLREFEQRMKAGLGSYIGEEQIRKLEYRGSVTNIVRMLPAIDVICPTKGMRTGQCWATSMRSGCPPLLFLDGMRMSDNDLEKHLAVQLAGIEFHPTATVPPQYNQTGSSCGVLLLWTREK
jgi:hypothetical protein